MQRISKVSTSSFRFLILSVVLVLFILMPGCVKGAKESGSGVAPDISPMREDQKTDYELVSISDSVEGILSTPKAEGRSRSADAAEGPFPLALLFGRSDRLGPGVRLGEGIGEAIRATRDALHRSGFAVLEIRKKRIRGIAGFINSSPRVPSASEVEKALQIIGHIERVDPETVGVIGAGDGAVAAAELAGSKHFRGQRSGTKRPGSQRSYAFLILLVDLLAFDAAIEAESPLVTVLQGVRAPVLILVLEEDSRESAESAKETYVAGLDNGNSSDYTVKIIRYGSSGGPGEQNPVQQFIFRWLQARF